MKILQVNKYQAQAQYRQNQNSNFGIRGTSLGEGWKNLVVKKDRGLFLSDLKIEFNRLQNKEIKKCLAEKFFTDAGFDTEEASMLLQILIKEPSKLYSTVMDILKDL